MNQVDCICCGRTLEVEPNDNPVVISPVYDGLIFRSTGNYGSTIFDPMPIGLEEILQVIICDDCIRTRAKRVIRLYNISTETTAYSEEFMP